MTGVFLAPTPARCLEKRAFYRLKAVERVLAYLQLVAPEARPLSVILKVCRLAPGSRGAVFATLRARGQIERPTRGTWRASGAPRHLLAGLELARATPLEDTL